MITRNEEEKCNNHSYAVLYYIPFYCNISLVFYAHCTHHMRHIYFMEKWRWSWNWQWFFKVIKGLNDFQLSNVLRTLFAGFQTKKCIDSKGTIFKQHQSIHALTVQYTVTSIAYKMKHDLEKQTCIYVKLIGN